MADPCPDVLYGIHSDPDRQGRCLWCRAKIGSKMPRPGLDFQARRQRAREQDPLQLEPAEDEYYDL